MPANFNQDPFVFIGTVFNDTIVDGYENEKSEKLDGKTETPVKAVGLEGNDTFETDLGTDLVAGDMVGDEWQFVEGKWVYNADAVVVSTYGADRSYDDVIRTGEGDDVLLGNGGNDKLYAGKGDDLVNAGRGNDMAFGGEGDDILNLEDGNDYAEGGYGADIINGGEGDDVIYGDIKDGNLVSDTGAANSLSQIAQSGDWIMSDSYGKETISHSAETVAGETYTISFEMAANLSAHYASASIEVLWNGEVVAEVEATSGVYQQFEVDVVSNGANGELGFRTASSTKAENYDFDGPIISYEKDVTVNGETVTVDAFAAGQAKLYHVIDGQLHVFDVASGDYVEAGDNPGFKINAVGFNIEDDLIYGVAKSNGVDSLGNVVNNTDIVMMDAKGETYRIGEGFYGDYVGDFDDQGNLWTFHTSLDRISVVDVDNLDADGNPQITHLKFPAGMFKDRTYDLAYDASQKAFFAVVAPTSFGGDGKVVRIDIENVMDGGEPTFTEVAITGTLYGDEMKNSMARGAFGAVFLDGDGNLYYGLNRGDHDLDSSTGNSGAIFKVNIDWQNEQAYAEFMSKAPSTGSNDGAVDPRSADAFVEVDADAAVLLRAPELTLVEGGNDSLRGGEGDDEIHGNEGNDDINGGTGDDVLFGDNGDDLISAGADNDFVDGGTGDDKLRGEAGNDEMVGGEGNDFIDGGAGDDILSGGEGNDKMVGGFGADTIEGGEGNDNLWGGNWTGDEASDVFVFKSDTGKDFVHDFEAEHDLIDVSDFETDWATLQNAMKDVGWATTIQLADLANAEATDQIILLGVDADNLSSENFVF